MTNPNNGWFDDPQDPTLERWWDGSAWSVHVRPKFTTPPPPDAHPAPAPVRTGPAGWYDDPQDESQLRYWDGITWTDQTTATMSVAPVHPRWPSKMTQKPWVNTDAAQVEGEYATDVWSGDRQPWEQPPARSFPQQSRPVPARRTSSWTEYPRNGPPSAAVGTFSSRLKSTQSKLIGAAVLVIFLIVGLQAGISEYREKRSESSEKISESSEKISESIPTEDDLPFQAGDEDRVAVSARDGNMYDFDAVYYLATAAACTDLYGVIQEKATILKAPTVGSVGSKERIKQQSEYLAATAAVYEAYAAVLATIGGLDNGATINGIPLTLNYSKRAELQEKFERYAETNAMIAEGLATASTNKEFLAVIKKHGFSGGPAIADYMDEAYESFVASFTDNSVGILLTSELVPACDSFYD